jgi:Type IV secretion system pilin
MKTLLAFDFNDIRLGSNNAETIGNVYGKESGGINILVSIILKNSLTIASIILLALLIFGGITFIINAGNGDSKKAEQSKSAITNSIIGFAIVLFAFIIIQIIEAITGLNILNSNL